MNNPVGRKACRIAKMCAALVLVCSAWSSLAFAAAPTDEQQAAKAAAAQAQMNRVTRGAVASASVMPTVTGIALRDLPTAQVWKPGDPIKEIPKRTYPVDAPMAPVNPTTWVRDPLLDLQQAADKAKGADRAFLTPAVNIAGLPFNGSTPPDTVGEVGPNHYVQMINGPGGSTVGIWDKNGTQLGGPFTLAGLGTGLCANGIGDPIVLYDPLADRWLLTEFADPNHLCVYVSQTADPGGTYFTYTFAAPSFPDYPKYAVWPDAYYVSSNEGGPSPVYALDRTQMLAGAAATTQRFTAPSLAGFGFQALTPGDLDGATAPPAGAPAYFARHRDDEVHNPGANDPATDRLEIWQFHVDWATPGNSTFTGPTNIFITEIDSDLCGLVSFQCFQQPSGQRLDPLRELVMWRLQYRNFGTHETLVGNLTTDVDDTDHGGIRWFELRKSGAGGWSLFQEGTYAPDGDNRWMGSIAMNGNGDIAVGYSVASLTQPADIRYVGRTAADPLGTMPQGEELLVAGSGSWGAERWGDYSAMSVDPADDCTFWYTHMYAAGGGQWGTRIGALQMAGCGGGGGDCGNGALDAAEQCDDGNALDGDGCSSACQVEDGYACTDPTPGSGNLIADPSFEAGTPNASWNEASTNFGTPLCDAGCPGVGASDGDWYAWFGGATAFEQGSLDQVVTIPNAPATLEFDLWVGACGNLGDFFLVRLNNNNVFTTDPCTVDGAYSRKSVDVSAFAVGNPLPLELFSVSISPGISNFFVDNMSLTTAGQPSVCMLEGGIIYAENFDDTPGWRDDWTFFNTGALDWDWGDTDDGVCGSENWLGGNTTGGAGAAACVDSDAAGIGIVNAYMCTDAITLGATPIGLDFLYNFQIAGTTPSAEDAFELLVGTAAPGPGTIGGYDSLLLAITDQGTEFGPPGVAQNVDLDAYAGQTVHLCFRYGGDFDWYAQVDDIVVTGGDIGGPDTDSDGLPDDMDNCIFAPNGPLIPDAGGNVQLDSDGDGIGNACDADIFPSANGGDCNVNFGDLSALKSAFQPQPYQAFADFNGDGLVNFGDLAFMKQTFFTGANPGPGPSGVPNNCAP